MYWYPKSVSQSAIASLQAVGLEFHNAGEMAIPDEEVKQVSHHEIILRGVHLVKQVRTFDGYREPPQVWSSLHGKMVDTGQELKQCPTCGYWMGRHMSPSDVTDHDRQCGPQYEWVLAEEVEQPLTLKGRPSHRR